MTKEKFLKLDNNKITADIIEEIYEHSLNKGIDYVDEICIDNGNIKIFYYYDGEPCYEKFSSIEDFKFKVKTYGI